MSRDQNFLIICTFQATAEVLEKTSWEVVTFHELGVFLAQEASFKLVGFLEIVNHCYVQHLHLLFFHLQEIPIHGSPQFANDYLGLLVTLPVLCLIRSCVVLLQAFLFLYFKVHLSIEMKVSLAKQKQGLIHF